ncbi:hypothetical protein INT44_008835, partial [Umbelopsis vinacea]
QQLHHQSTQQYRITMNRRLDQLPLVDHKVDPRLEDRYRRRLHSPQSLAPNMRSRRIQVGAIGISAGKLTTRTSSTQDTVHHCLQYLTENLCFSFSFTVLTTYIVLFADFGTEKHCFSPIRQWFNVKRHGFWSLSDREKNDLKEQGRL